REQLQCFRRKHTSEAQSCSRCMPYSMPNTLQSESSSSNFSFFFPLSIKEKKAGISGPRRWHEARERAAQRTFWVREQLQCFRRKHTSEAQSCSRCMPYSMPNTLQSESSSSNFSFFFPLSIKEKKAGISGPRRWHEARERAAQRTFWVHEQLQCFRRKHTSEAQSCSR